MKKIFLSLAALATSSLMWAAAPTPQAQALCISPREVGEWVNADEDTNSITRAEVRFQCQDQRLNGKPHPPGDPFYIRLFGACVPTDCEWEEIGARPNEARWLRASLDQDFARRSIWAQSEGPDRLRVWIWTDFKDPGREDYASDNYFVRR